jgi:hypothetical protein
MSLIRINLYTMATIAGFIIVADSCRVRDFNPRKDYSIKSLPEGAPSQDQGSIDLAMKIFDVQTYNCSHPKFDPNLLARGETRASGLLLALKQEVFIGPDAFESWGVLGSTLAHELEVHCRQNISLVTIKDVLKLDGIREAEFEAYQHEIEQAQRFQLTPEELQMIQEVQKDYIK